MDNLTILLKVDRQQLNKFLGNTPNVKSKDAMHELLFYSLSEELNEYGNREPTGIDFKIVEIYETS